MHKKSTFNKMRVTIGGIFKTGIEEYDERMVYSRLSLFNKLFSRGVSEVYVKLAPHAPALKIKGALKKRFSLEVSSWQDLYPALVSALTLETYAMITIVALITLMAIMSLISLLFLFLMNKSREIALLKAMGMPLRDIKKLFIAIGMGISLSATMVGIAVAALVSWLLERYPFIHLPDAYYVSHLPAELTWGMVIAVVIGVSLMSFMAILLPVRHLTRLSVTHILKREA
jgi:lipoprotein-releasing system permease protein